MASALALSLTPRPLTMMAIRGASGLPGSGFTGWAKASAGRAPSAAILGIAPCGDASANFCSSAGASVAGIDNSWRAPVLPSMMVMVLVAPAGGALACSAAAGTGVGLSLRSGFATTFTGACPSNVFAGVPECRLIGATATGSPPNGLLPSTAHTTKVPKNSASPPAVIGTLNRRRFLRCWPSGVSKSSPVMGRSGGPPLWAAGSRIMAGSLSRPDLRPVPARPLTPKRHQGPEKSSGRL